MVGLCSVGLTPIRCGTGAGRVRERHRSELIESAMSNSRLVAQGRVTGMEGTELRSPSPL